MARGRILEIPDILRAAGIQVVVHNGWADGGYADLPDTPAAVLHHDASAPGSSPGALGWIIGAVLAREPGAQIWIDYFGVWHFIASGECWHTGKVGDGFPGNSRAFGIETDHTTGEAWPADQLASITKGLAAIAKAWSVDPATWLFFHKQIAIPKGRKQDPDGLDIEAYRNTVRDAMNQSVPAPSLPATPAAPAVPETPTEEDDMFTDDDRRKINFVFDALTQANIQGQKPDPNGGLTGFAKSVRAIGHDNQENQNLLRSIEGLLTRIAQKAGV